MEPTVKRQWILEGLDCANCAMKIENKVSKLEGVASCSVNFATKTLTMETDESFPDTGIAQVERTVTSMEPHVRLLEKNAGGAAALSRPHTHDAEARESGHDHNHDHAAPHEHGHALADSHAHGHSHSHGEGETLRTLLRLGIGAALAAAAYLIPAGGYLEFGLFLLAYLAAGGNVVWQAARNIVRGQVFDENFLMALATIGAFAIGQYPEGVAVMLFYQVGELFQGLAVNRSRRSITALMDIRPETARLRIGDETEIVPPGQVKIGEIIVVQPGEKVPLDGTVIEGSAMMDTSALTGESVPRSAEPGSTVLSGFINKNGVVAVRVTQTFAESAVSKILELVQNASNNKAKTENFITRFARGYTPVVVITAALLAVVPPLLIPGATFSDWIYRALVFLVISCPCALVVSIPLGFFGGIGAASRSGILVKGSNYLEALNDVKTVVFDKTGTLTKGQFKVTGIYPAEGMTEDELLRLAAYAESHSGHPIAESIVAAYGGSIAGNSVSDYREISGHGIRAAVEGRTVLAGNARLMEREGIAFRQPGGAGTIVHLAVDGQYAGSLVIADEIKEDAVRALTALRQIGVRKTVMLTGDALAVAEDVGKRLGVGEIHAELLPQDKVERIERLESEKTGREKIAFVGDGINDTPVLARADVGIAMGGLGSDAAIEAADIVIMTDEPSKIAAAIGIARQTRTIVWQNIWFALGIKAVFLLLGAFGIATMWEAVFSDVGVTVLAVLNSMRALRAPASADGARG
ncbi:heavy metal translocating P-type ATPase [Paenibacillus sabinae]|uniref:Heavy metal-transporting ATPase n=1 Tax=Paenibacillus sabinae T27 TaxID=1268072 RepID=X4ZS51_9BACL|nr:heavy metal translocating P-type ATPase [Paenibacillus sabinae]AHV95268.1 heavy metal-transporting ATPase [Paenibacillus sabinae T27]